MPKRKEFRWMPERRNEYALHIEKGSEFWGPGRIKLVIHGNGNFQGEIKRRGKPRVFSGQLSDSDLDELFSGTLLEILWDLKFKKRKGRPDESKLELRLLHKDDEVAVLEVWEGLARENPMTKRILAILRTYAGEFLHKPKELDE